MKAIGIERQPAYSRSIMWLALGVFLSWAPVQAFPADARGYLCAYTENTLFDCTPSSVVNTVCHKTTFSVASCTAACPHDALYCSCTLSDGFVETLTSTGKVATQDVLVLEGTPKQDCGGDCKFEEINTEGTIYWHRFTCLNCTTVGRGVPGTREGKVCKDAILLNP